MKSLLSFARYVEEWRHSKQSRRASLSSLTLQSSLSVSFPSSSSLEMKNPFLCDLGFRSLVADSIAASSVEGGRRLATPSDLNSPSVTACLNYPFTVCIFETEESSLGFRCLIFLFSSPSQSGRPRNFSSRLGGRLLHVRVQFLPRFIVFCDGTPLDGSA